MMNVFADLKLSQKIMAVILGPLVLAFSVFGWYSTSLLKKSSEAKTGAHLQDLALDTAKAIDSLMHNHIQAIKVLSQADVFEQKNNAKKIQYLNETQEANPTINTYWLLDKKGTILASTNQSDIGKSFLNLFPGHKPYFNEYLKLGQGDVFVYDSGTKQNFERQERLEWQVILITPQTDDTNTIVESIIVAALDPSEIKAHISTLDDRTIGDEAAYLLSDDGENLYSLDKTLSLFELHPEINKLAAVAGDVEGYSIYQNIQKRELISATGDLAEYGINNASDWTVFVTVPYADALASVVQARRALLATIGVSIVLMYLFVTLLMRRILSPLQGVIARLKEISASSGDLTREILVTSKDEIGDVGKSFNNMLEGLRKIIVQMVTASTRISSSAQQLASTAEQMNASTQEVSSTVQQISKGSDIQIAKIEENNKSMEEMSASVRKVAQSTEFAAKKASESVQIALVGGKAVKNAVEKIDRTFLVVTESAEAIRGLGEKSKEISSIVDVITGIADQTNLLALNAAIEAARAGEAGRGFAVVAEEVRKLAEGSSKAADQIGGLIKDVQNATDKAVTSIEESSKEVTEGKAIVTNAGRSLEEIVIKVQEVGKMVDQVSQATVQQGKGAAEVARTMKEVSQTADQNAIATEQASASTEQMTASMEEMASSAQELADIGRNLQDLVGQFKTGEERGKSEAPQPTPALSRFRPRVAKGPRKKVA